MKQELFLYLICHDRKDIKTHTYIGCVADFKSRLKQHNGELNGGPRITRRAAGSWYAVIVLKLPKERSFKSKDVKKEWKQSSRGLESRVKKGLLLANKYNLTIYISKDINSDIKIIKYLSSKFNNGEISMNKKEWEEILNDEV